jgi:hypothetical protein
MIQVISSGSLRLKGHAAGMGKRKYVYRVFVGKPEGRRPLSWEDILNGSSRSWM